MKIQDIQDQIVREVVSEEQIEKKLGEIAKLIDEDYKGKDLLLVGVLGGAFICMADLSRHISVPLEIEWIAISTYGHGTTSTGVVRILKDLFTDIKGRHVVIVEDILDSGLTLSWLKNNLSTRGAASVEIFTLLRKPDAIKIPVEAKYVGFDIPNEFVIGYGLDYAQKYRNLRSIAVLHPDVYTQKS
jgi:hypoxanthine phosphoribosyltransferase